MSTRLRRGVKFPHNAKHSNGHADIRRASFSDVSEEGSPAKSRSSGSLQNIKEVGNLLTALVRRQRSS
jgi:phosphatidate cytidylyltransferase